MTSAVYKHHWILRLFTIVLLLMAGILILFGDARGQTSPNQVDVELFGRE